MPLLESKPIKLGTIMPDFTLKTPDKKTINGFSQIGKKGLLIIFTCNHCPYAQAIWDRIIKLEKEINPLGINTIAINPNINPQYPEDSPEAMLEEIKSRKINFPYLIDEDQSIARKYDAQCTPDIYLLDSEKKLVYHGRLDDNWKDESRVKVQDLKNAALALVNEKEISSQQIPSMGCSIKWVG